MRSCVADGQTDRRTDGAGYIGPAEGNGGSKKGKPIKNNFKFQVLTCWTDTHDTMSHNHCFVKLNRLFHHRWNVLKTFSNDTIFNGCLKFTVIVIWYNNTREQIL